MGFVTGLPLKQVSHDLIWVIFYKLTKSAHFLPVKYTYPSSKLAKIFLSEIVKLYGVLVSIISDRDPKFPSRLLKAFHNSLGTKWKFSTAYHPQTNGQSERTIQPLEYMLQACVLEDGGSWNNFQSLIKFSYNNIYHSSISMAPYEAL